MIIFNTTQIRKKYSHSVWGWQNSSGLFNVWRATKLFCFSNFSPTLPFPVLFFPTPQKNPPSSKARAPPAACFCTWWLFTVFPLSCPSSAVGKSVHNPESTRHVPERVFQNLCWRAGPVWDTWLLFTAVRTSAVLGPRSGSGWNARQQQRTAVPTHDAVIVGGRVCWLCL